MIIIYELIVGLLRMKTATPQQSRKINKNTVKADIYIIHLQPSKKSAVVADVIHVRQTR